MYKYCHRFYCRTRVTRLTSHTCDGSMDVARTQKSSLRHIVFSPRNAANILYRNIVTSVHITPALTFVCTCVCVCVWVVVNITL